MPEPRPRVSVGMTSYNKGAYLAEAIESVLGQTFEDWELVISDDGSTDDSRAICEQFAAREPRIRYFAQPTNLGMVPNFDFVLKEARGEAFMWLSSDDRIDPTWLEVCLASLTPEVAISFGRVVLTELDGEVRTTYPLFQIPPTRASRMWRLYWTMFAECNLLHGVTHTRLPREIGGLAPFRHAGIGFDFLYVWRMAQEGALVATDGPRLLKRDSSHNNQFERSTPGQLLREALLPWTPIWRVWLFHTVAMPPLDRVLYGVCFPARVVWAILKWYAKGLRLVVGKLARGRG